MSSEDKLRQQLLDMAMNLWWSWNPATIKLFRDLDPGANGVSTNCKPAKQSGKWMAR